MGQWGDCTHSVTPSVNRMRPSTDTEESPCSVKVTSFRPPVALSKREEAGTISAAIAGTVATSTMPFHSEPSPEAEAWNHSGPVA